VRPLGLEVRAGVCTPARSSSAATRWPGIAVLLERSEDVEIPGLRLCMNST
jgi:hypothetical protein